MHYYKKNIGDYYKKAGRLTMLQHGAYTVLIDACYDREKFPTLDEALDWSWASTQDELDAVKFVLNKFFVLNGDIYEQNRIKDELNEYKGFCQKNSENGKKGGRPKAKLTQPVILETQTVNNKTQNNPDISESKPNQEPLTNNHKPITKDQKRGKNKFSPPSVSEVSDYCKQRQNNINPDSFVSFYESKGWMIGKNKMRSWKAAMVTWEKRKQPGGKQNESRSAVARVSDNLERLYARETNQQATVTLDSSDFSEVCVPILDEVDKLN